MFRNSSPFTTDASSYTESIRSNGYPLMDETVSQSSNLSRPSAKSIYLQRKQYAASVRQVMDKNQYRVEHLFTFELDGRELRSVLDCVEQLQLLEEMGRVWGQTMLLGVQASKLMLMDIETKMELESIAASDILELKAVLDSGTFNSLLTVSVQTRKKNNRSVFVFQCHDVRADFIQRDLSGVLSNKSRSSSGPVAPPPQWMAPYWEDNNVSEPELIAPKEEEPFGQLSSKPYTQLDRNVDILNHILNDIEIVMGQIGAALAKKASKKKKKKANYSMPNAAEFASCLQKIKYGFNLLVELNGKINNPTAPEYIHFFFSMLAFVAPHSPVGLPMTIVIPLLTPECVQLLSEEVTPEEDQLWQSLGDCWNVPSNQWPNADIQPYMPEFTDGWRPPDSSPAPQPKAPLSRVETVQPAPSMKSANWRTPPPPQEASPEEPQYLRVVHDFTSRNSKELTIRKGETLEASLLDMSRQWWKVRDTRGDVGYVPNNVLEPCEEELEQVGQYSEEIGRPVVLTKRSRPAEVKMWLENKAFSKITIRCLGGLSGATLLGMTKEELKTLCPEEGGRVFFQLQIVRSTIAAAS
ncbi:Epidermal growth factor receptor kinase substrate 8-like protein 3 [Takifugu flavidus]|uniref:Epidermal growth factor receptor kinase substrate 8-like protein 3 n=1 Tax=Takifugu flavidus TaxID=433684 RepID=A0A5C6N3V0_9TELE|nr:Epidermal growth factor receptor kinase substrate 8-like protein 3 [Takifugu flavidus]